MEEKRKSISGQKRGGDFSTEERHRIIKEYLSSDMTKRDVWEKYTGQREEHGELLRWMRILGYKDKVMVKVSTFASNSDIMSKEKVSEAISQSFEELQLKKRVEELEKQLKDAEMKSIAYSTMIDIAEQELNIKIRKKYNSKPSNK